MQLRAAQRKDLSAFVFHHSDALIPLPSFSWKEGICKHVPPQQGMGPVCLIRHKRASQGLSTLCCCAQIGLPAWYIGLSLNSCPAPLSSAPFAHLAALLSLMTFCWPCHPLPGNPWTQISHRKDGKEDADPFAPREAPKVPATMASSFAGS